MLATRQITIRIPKSQAGARQKAIEISQNNSERGIQTFWNEGAEYICLSYEEAAEL